jgi:anti-sigma factor RsiW
MAVLRTKCIATKVTDEEYARLEALAGAQTMSEWVRTVLLTAGSRSGEPVVLAEILAFRMIVLNVLFRISSAQPVTAEDMQRLVDRADSDRVRRAHERLAEVERRQS